MDVYDQAWKNIVRPTQVKTKKHLLGPQERLVGDCSIHRIDLDVVNRNQKNISGFVFHAKDKQAEQTLLYLHGNGGSKLEALPLVKLIPKFNMNVVSFDLLGCGNSDSETLTYGINEVFDIRDFLQEVRKHIRVGRVTLWGRSMGALCSIMFAQMYAYEVSGLILDSPFRSLSKVVDRIAIQSVAVPEILLKPVLYFIKKRASKEANYDIFTIDYLSIFNKLNSNMPVLFIFSHFDGIVPAEEVFQFYNAYKGPKDFCQIYQTHDEDRTEDLFNQCMMWLTRTKRKNIEGLVQAREHLYTNKQTHKPKSLC